MTTEPLPPPPSAPPDTGTVDHDNPWPGLASFREADQALFRGRDEEVEALFRLVMRERLTILFGLSGLGKSSLLQAGLFPRLREQNVLPVTIRLDFSERALPFPEQVLAALAREAAAAQVEAPAATPGETLWEYFHRQGCAFWSPRNRPVTPLLVFDQFEEVFTLGKRRPQAAEAFLVELAALTEGHPPEAVRARLDENPEEARGFAFGRHGYKVLLSLREDFLPDLEGLRGRLRSIGQNRLRLQRMHGGNALLVLDAGSHLLEPGVAEQVVRFCAGRQEETEDGEAPLGRLEIEPALLGVVCRELNNRRRRRGLPRITAGLLEGNREEILTDLYERSLTDLPREVRTFVEERLLTRSGFRDSVALESALEEPGVDRETLSRLVDRRLLRIEDRGGVQRVELTHDVLTRVARNSRDTRRQREAQEQAGAAQREAEERMRQTRRKLRRSRQALALLGVLLLAVVGLVLYAWRIEEVARRALASSDMERAVNLQDSSPAHALAYLARAVDREPEVFDYRTLLIYVLLGKSWPLPMDELRHPDEDWVVFSADARHVAIVLKDGTVLFHQTDGLQPLGKVQARELVDEVHISAGGRVAVTVSSAGRARLWDVPAGKELGHYELGRLLCTTDADLVCTELSADGKLLLVRNAVEEGDQGDRVSFLDARTGKPAGPPLPGPTKFSKLLPDGRALVVARGEARIWDIREGRTAAGPFGGVSPVVAADASRDGGRVATASRTGRLHVWDAASVSQVGPDIEGSPSLSHLRLSLDGKRVAALIDPLTARVWDVETGEVAGTATSPKGLTWHEPSRDGRLLLTLAQDDSVQVWDVAAGEPLAMPILDALDLRFTPEADGVLTAGFDGAVRVWQVRRTEPMLRLLVPAQATQGHLLGETVAMAAGRQVHFHGMDGSVRRTVSLPDPVRFLRLGPGGKRLALVTSRAVHVLDLAAGEREIGRFQAGGAIQDALFSDDGSALLAFTERAVSVWDLNAPGHPGWRLTHPARVNAAAFRPDGRRIATASRDRIVRLWDFRKGAVHPIQHRNEVMDVAFSADGRRLASGSMDGVAFVWDADTGRSLGNTSRDRSSLSGVTFHPAGRLLLAWSDDTVRSWREERGDWLPASEPMELPGSQPDHQRPLQPGGGGGAPDRQRHRRLPVEPHDRPSPLHAGRHRGHCLQRALPRRRPARLDHLLARPPRLERPQRRGERRPQRRPSRRSRRRLSRRRPGPHRPPRRPAPAPRPAPWQPPSRPAGHRARPAAALPAGARGRGRSARRAAVEWRWSELLSTPALPETAPAVGEHRLAGLLHFSARASCSCALHGATMAAFRPQSEFGSPTEARRRSQGMTVDLTVAEGFEPVDWGVEEEDTGGGEILEPFNPADIRIETRPSTVDLLIKRLKAGEIDLVPEFQRAGGLWKPREQSRLIESFLIRIPIPAFYMDATNEERWLVVDGLQRLTVLQRFVVDQSFALENLEFWRQYEGLRFSGLPRPMRRRIEETQLIIYLVQPGTPPEVKYTIFRRINTGGLPLSSQEIRHALNQGPATTLLKRLSESEEFVHATSGGIRDRRMTDRECALRFLAFVLTPYDQYRSQDLDGFLHRQMRLLNQMSDLEREDLARRFLRAMSFCLRTLRQRFVPQALPTPYSPEADQQGSARSLVGESRRPERQRH